MINRIGIVGGGKMGKDIFRFLSNFPFNLIWVIRSESGFESANRTLIRKNKKYRSHIGSEDSVAFTGSKEVILARDIGLLADCDLIIEAITEDQLIKSELFRQIDSVVNPAAIFATNTSSVPVRSLVPSNGRLEHFIGLHFFYPVRLKNLAEVNILPETSITTNYSITDFLSKTGKYYKILNEPDHFLFNRLLLPLQAGVYNLHEEKKIPIHLLDQVVRENLFPIGIFFFFDQVGIDVMYNAITNYTRFGTGNDFYQPLLGRLRKMTLEGNLGVKTGRGFYQYPWQESCPLPGIDPSAKEFILKKIYQWYMAPALEVLNRGILSREEIGFIYEEYLGADKGPVELATELGFIPKNN